MKTERQYLCDWHRADIRAALEKRGTNLRKLSREAGLAENTLKNVLDRRWPKGQLIVAKAIGVEPSTIWPSRYPGVEQLREAV